MMLYFLVFVIFCLIILCGLDMRKPHNYPPGPLWLPIVGNVTYFRKRLANLGYHHLVWDELAKKYGAIVGLRLGRNYVVTVSGPAAVREVLTRDEFDGRPDGFFFRLRTFGKRLGIVFSDGKFWQKQRKFSIKYLRSFGLGKRDMEQKIQEESRDLIDNLTKICFEPIYMHTAFDISVLNVLWTMMAGERFALDDVRLKKLLNIIHDAFKLADMSGGIMNQMPFLRYIAPDACGYTQIMSLLTRLWEFLEETIAEHRKTVCYSHARDLIDAFLQKMNVKDLDGSNESFTDEQLLSLCIDLFMAGSETTSNTLSFAILYMLAYPDVQKRVQAEMDDVVGRHRWPSMQDKVKLPYTEAVLMEVQRMTNVPPLGIAHRATRDVDLLGYRVPQGTIVLTSLYSVHMDCSYWKDPDNFRPERFIDDEGKVFSPELHFIPFGNGKRRCLGESLAKTSYFMFFTSLLHNFHILADPKGGTASIDGLDGVTISPKPFKVLLNKRTD